MTNDTQDRGKRPIAAAAGPYGHPLHPIFVTIPIGAWTASLVFDALSHLIDQPAVFVRGAFWLIGIGIVGALLASLFGFMDLMAIPRNTRAFRVGITHMVLNLAVTTAFVVALLLRREALDAAAVPVHLIVVSAVTMGLLGVSGWLGGTLSYRYGVRVADEATQAKAFEPLGRKEPRRPDLSAPTGEPQQT